MVKLKRRRRNCDITSQNTLGIKERKRPRKLIIIIIVVVKACLLSPTSSNNSVSACS